MVAKLLCEKISPALPRGNINDYKAALLPAIPDLPDTEVFVLRYGLAFMPWSNWAGATSPLWWRSYNNVKHERDAHFHEATPKNALNPKCMADISVSESDAECCYNAFLFVHNMLLTTILGSAFASLNQVVTGGSNSLFFNSAK